MIGKGGCSLILESRNQAVFSCVVFVWGTVVVEEFLVLVVVSLVAGVVEPMGPAAFFPQWRLQLNSARDLHIWRPIVLTIIINQEETIFQPSSITKKLHFNQHRFNTRRPSVNPHQFPNFFSSNTTTYTHPSFFLPLQPSHNRATNPPPFTLYNPTCHHERNKENVNNKRKASIFLPAHDLFTREHTMRPTDYTLETELGTKTN